MSGDFRISPESLDAAAQGMLQCGEDFAAAVETLQARVLGAGSPWGDDETGSMFGEIYTECTSLGLHALDHVAQLLGGVGVGLGQMSENVQAGDRKNAPNLDKLG